MNISLRSKVIVAIFALIILCSLFFTALLNIQGNELLEQKQRLLTHASLDPIDRRMDVIHRQLELVAIQVLHNQDIINAFANRNREQLASLTDPLMIQLQDRGIDALHFHLPDATSFYRAHYPTLYGDYLDFRPMVLHVQAYKEGISGMETGVAGVTYRYVVPVFVDDEYVGSFETGKIIKEDTLNMWKRSSGGEWYLFEFEGETLGEMLASTSESFAVTLCEDEIKKLTAGETVECANDSNIVNLVSLKNYSGEINWAVVRVFDNSELIELQVKQFVDNIVFGMALATLFGFISYIFLQKLFAPFGELIRVTDLWALGELNKPLQVKTGDEIEKLADTMENMRVSLGIQRKELEASYEELSVANEKLKEMYEIHNQEIIKASELHKRFLPEELPAIKGVSVAAHYVPAGMAGGDFYNAIKSQGRLITYVGDVCGHGLDGAILNVFIRNVIDRFIERTEQQEKSFLPSEMLDYVVEKYLQERFPEDYHFAIVVAVYDPIEQHLTYANAGNHVPLLFCEEEKIDSLREAGLPISTAIPKELMVYQDTMLEIKSDDWVLLMSTDGIVEEERDGQQYGEERLVRALQKGYNAKADDILDSISKDLCEYTGKDTYSDDVTMIALSAGSPYSIILNK